MSRNSYCVESPIPGRVGAPCPKSGHAVTLFVAITTSLAGSTASAQVPENDPHGRQWAVLIGIEKYKKARPLQFTINDVRQLAETLRGRGGFDRRCVVEVTDNESDPGRRPLRASLLKGVPLWLKDVTANDRLIVYFSGHGFRDRAGKLYLAPIDCDPADPETTGISVEWFKKQIGDCPAGFKFLILDACHAGSDKGEDHPSNIPLREIGEMFRDVSGVITLASSTEDEKSQIWDEKQQSLFSYWLNEGLKGHADTDGDGAVDVDELNKYVHRNVTRTAAVRFKRKQTPVRIIRTGVGSPEVLQLKPLKLKKLLADIADQIALAVEEERLEALGQTAPDATWKSPGLGVLEFTTENGGAILGADLGPAGRWCSMELERQLLGAAGGRMHVVEYHRLLEALSKENVVVKGIYEKEKMKRVSQKLGGMPLIAVGSVKSRSGELVSLTCKVVRTDSDIAVGSAGGTAILTESDWAMFGSNVWVQPDDRRPATPGTKDASLPHNDVVLKRLDERAKGAHPMQNPAFPFRLSIVINGKERPGVFKGNELYVPVRKGEEYAVQIENRSGRLVCLRLLVDGLNTLPEPEGLDVRLMPSLMALNDIPNDGEDLIILAAVSGALHIRMFDDVGKMVVDTDESRLSDRAGQVEVLKKQVADLWPPHKLTPNEKRQLIALVAAIVGHNPENAKGLATMRVAKRVSLDSARHWILDPAKARVNAIAGFVSQTGEQGKLGLFKITDAEKSLAARQRFTEQIGLITAAFYEPVASRSANRSAPGTTIGDERTANLTERTGIDVGSLIATVNIHYVDADELHAAK